MRTRQLRDRSATTEMPAGQRPTAWCAALPRSYASLFPLSSSIILQNHVLGAKPEAQMTTNFSPNQDTKFLLGHSGQKKIPVRNHPPWGCISKFHLHPRITFVPGICAGASYFNSMAVVLNSTPC